MSQASRYKIGDLVEYRYSGPFQKDLIFLTEEIIEKNGNQLTILVHLKNSVEERKWKQFVTDTIKNQKNNKIDRLVEILASGKEVELLNRNNSDLFRLYRGTYLSPDGPAENVVIDDVELNVCGQKIIAKRTRGKQRVKGKVYSFENFESEDFVWKHIGSQYTADGDIFYKVEVTHCGR